MSNCLWLYGLLPTRVLCPWDSLGKDTGVGCHALPQRIFPIQGSSPCLIISPELAVGFFTTSASWEAPWASLVAQTVKNLPAMQKTWVRSLGWEDPLEKGVTTNSSILAWRIPWTEEPGELYCLGFPGSPDGRELASNVGAPGLIPGLGRSPREGNGKPLQYSCLGNSMDRGVWWATVQGSGHDWMTNTFTFTFHACLSRS